MCESKWQGTLGWKSCGSQSVPISFLTRLAKNQSARLWAHRIRSACPLSFPISRGSLCSRAMSSESVQCDQQRESMETHASSAVLSDASAACASYVPAVAGTDSSTALTAPNESATKLVADATRISKVKVALVIGYNGSRFGGLQRNPGQFAIEDVLEDAVCVGPCFSFGFGYGFVRGPCRCATNYVAFVYCLTFFSAIKLGESQSATIETFTKSAGPGQPGRTKACMPREMSCPSKCSRHASSSKTGQRCAAPHLFQPTMFNNYLWF